MLHGYGASGTTEEAYLSLTSATDAHGMFYVYPDGTVDTNGNRFWNATNACCDLFGSGVDDSSYLAGLIGQVRTQFNVDPQRIFIVGHANGGFMAYRMACDHADVVAAVVSFEGATYADSSQCKPIEPVATLEIHGTADQTISYNGGTTSLGAYPSAPITAQTWAAYDGCSPAPDSPAPAPHPIEQGLPPATVTAYSSGCAPGGHAELWTQTNGTHIPSLNPTFQEQVIQFLLSHPKPSAAAPATTTTVPPTTTTTSTTTTTTVPPPTTTTTTSTTPPPTTTTTVAPSGCTRTVTGRYTGGLVVARGTTCIVNAQIQGSVIVQRGAAIVIENSTISGSVTANNATSARICGSATAGSITINGSTGFVLVGDTGDDQCAPNSIGGALNLQGNTAGLEAIGNAVTGAATNTANSGRGPFPEDTAPEVGGTPPDPPSAVLVTPATSSPATRPTDPTTPPTWTVRAGDTLWGIADVSTSDPLRYPEIFALNTDILTSPDALRTGMVLTLPAGSVSR